MLYFYRFVLLALIFAALRLLSSNGALTRAANAEEAAGTPICADLYSAALASHLPMRFFARLIWQESRFRPFAISRAGAQGIAQFMPGTAAYVQLANPFDAASSIDKSAELLARLRARFGNLGLAAAAYNAGPRRVADWLAGRGNLPQETVHYVRLVTGHEVTEWRTAADELPLDADPAPDCGMTQPDSPAHQESPHDMASTGKPAWAVQLVGDRSEREAMAAFQRMQVAYSRILASRKPLIAKSPAGRNAFWYRVRLGTATRQEANLLCSHLRQVGGSCLVQPN